MSDKETPQPTTLPQEPEEMDEFRKWQSTCDPKIILDYIDKLQTAAEQLERQIEELKQREQAALASFREERERAQREGNRVVELQQQLSELQRENESLRAQCGLRQISGYQQGLNYARGLCMAVLDSAIVKSK